MNILMLAPRAHVHGPIPKLTPLLVEGLEAMGSRVVLAPWGRRHDREGTLAKLRSRAADIAGIRSRMALEPFDVLVVQTSHDWNTLTRDIALLLAVRSRRVPAILQLHGSNPGRLPSLPRWSPFLLATRWLMHLVEGALTLSEEERREWEAAFPHGRFEVVKNPTVPLPPVETPARSGPEIVFLFVGRLLPGKGIFETLEALARVRERGPARLVIAGDGPAREEVRQRVRSLGLEEAVILTGYLQAEDLARAYAEADVFVLPTYLTEGFPTAIQEAMQAGLPIITTAIRGAAHHLREGEQALFVPPRDPQALAERMERLRADASLRRRMGKASRKKIEEFAPGIVAREYLEAIHRILGESPPGARA